MFTRFGLWAVLVAAVGVFRAFGGVGKLDYATYLPGYQTNYVAVDSRGFLYFSGTSDTACDAVRRAGPAAAGVWGTVSKLGTKGEGVVWTACAPGEVGGLALDEFGAIYVANNQDGSTVVRRWRADATEVVYSRAIVAVSVKALVVDRVGNVYLTGDASTGLPTTEGAEQRTLTCEAGATSCRAGFLAKLDAAGGVALATYGPGVGLGVAANSRGEAWVTGSMKATYGNNCYLAKYGLKGQRLVFKAFGGGRVFQWNTYAAGYSVAVDTRDAVYNTGYATHGLAATPGVIQPSNPYDYTAQAFLAKFDDEGNVVYGTFLGDGMGRAVTVDSQGRASVAIYRAKTVEAGAPGPNCGGSQGSELLLINSEATEVIANRGAGGTVLSMVQDEAGALYVGGTTGTSAFLASPGAYLREYPFGKMASGFAAKYDLDQPAGLGLTCVANSASLWAGRNRWGFDGSVAPGELVTMFGSGFQSGGPVEVTFDEVKAPVLWASDTQMNAVVPFRVGRESRSTMLRIKSGQAAIGAYELPVSEAVPGIFTTSDQAAGMSNYLPAAALNQDGTVNGADNSARAGSVITLYATGAGAFDREMVDGSIGPAAPPFARPVIGVSALVWPPETRHPGTPADVVFSGQAPGLVAGVVQVNVRIPVDTPAGAVRIGLFLGAYPTLYSLMYVR